MAIIAYLRVSTDEQAQSGLGLEAQLEAIRRATGEPQAVHRDEGYSGGDPRRPGLQSALEGLKAGDVLVVAKRDRLARDGFLAAWIEKEVKRRKARVVSAAGEGTDADDPASVLMRRMVDAFAEYERALIGARTAAAMAVMRSQGRHTGGSVPYGYHLAGDGRHLVLDPDEQQALSLMRQLRTKGQSYRQIAAELVRSGVANRAGKVSWHPQTVKQILAQKTGAANPKAAA